MSHLHLVPSLRRSTAIERHDAMLRMYDADARTTDLLVAQVAARVDAAELNADERRGRLVDLYVSTQTLRAFEAIDRVCSLSDELVAATLAAVPHPGESDLCELSATWAWVPAHSDHEVTRP